MVSKTLPVLELIEVVIAVDRVDDDVGVACVRPLRVGGGKAVAGLEQPEGPADAVDLDKIGVLTALAGGPVLVERAGALLVNGGAGGIVPDPTRGVDLVGGSKGGDGGP